MTTYDASSYSGQALKSGDVVNIPYSGSSFQIELPKGEYKLECWGAEGGARTSGNGGKGGYSVGTLTLNARTTVWAYAGGSGDTGGTSGGFNGGGRRESYNGGGGGSDFRVGRSSLYARVIVAGGGGSQGRSESSYFGGAGGGTVGQTYQGGGFGSNVGPGNTTYSGSSTSTTASSQTMSTSGSSDSYGGFGFGGNGITRSSGHGGAGGGGWYGGSGTYPDSSADDDKAGAGGSGYVYTSETASQYPSGCLLNSSHYLADAETIIGTSAFASPSGSSETGHQGDGYCRITVIDAGVTATWIADGQTIRTDTVSPGDRLTPPDVSKTGYTTSWTAGSSAIDFDTYVMPDQDVTFTAVFTPRMSRLILYDNGITTLSTETYGTVVTLPNGSDTKRRFVGWWNGTGTVMSVTMMGEDVTLTARYDESGQKITVDSVALQPNPVEASKTVLLSVSLLATESVVPKWSGMTITTGDGLPMSSPYQIGIWDTSELDPLATFEDAGIKTSGMDVPPIEAQTVPLPRCGVWSSAISGADGSCDVTITGSGSNQYTSSVVLYSDADVYVTKATISYNGGTAIPVTGTGDRLQFPSGTYSSFAIRIMEVSKPFSHVRVRNIAPGGL